MKGENNQICKAHSGFNARIEQCEDDVSALWKKWDRMQVMIVATLVGVIANLLVVIFK